MKKSILIAGGTGLVGSRLIQLLDRNKFDINVLTRKQKSDSGGIRYFQWNIEKMEIDHKALEVDYILNMTGASIADKRWDSKRKEVIVKSRVNSALLLKKGLEESECRPKVFISASAIGIYGNRGDEILHETSKKGEGFLADCCHQWETVTSLINPMVERMIINRFGIVLSKKGGALPKMLMTKNLGVYNYFGDGKQYYSWIHIDDLCNFIIYQIENNSAQGVFNVVSPSPKINRRFILEVKNVLGGIAVFPIPEIGIRILFGEMGNVVLDSTRVMPTRILETTFRFEHPILMDAIKDIIERDV